jgi:hypothetical protein
MVWFYHRGAEELRIETRFNEGANLFELIWHHPDGTRVVERFSSESTFRHRAQIIERRLTTEQWQSSGAPVLLPDGWRTGRIKREA